MISKLESLGSRKKSTHWPQAQHQAATIQKVSTQLEINKASRLMVDENDEVGQRVNDS